METVDIVIPWVDGNDNNWIKKRADFLDDWQLGQDSSDDSRFFYDYGTLKYVFRSIEKNAPWVHRIFLVTDEQRPSWLNIDRVTIVDHTEFIDGALPTFNASVITSSVYKIPNLSENFILMNDDLMFWTPNEITDYFKDGKPVDALIESSTVPFEDGFFHVSLNGVALMNRIFKKREMITNHLTRFFNVAYGLTQLRTVLSLPYGGFVGFLNPHFAMGLTRKEFEELVGLAQKEFAFTWSHRLRNPGDLNEWAVRYYRNLKGDFTPGKIKGIYLTISDFRKTVRLSEKMKVVVINDDNCRDKAALDNLNQMLNERFGDKSKYER